MSRHKGEYKTHEDTGAKDAPDADTAVRLGKTGHGVPKKEEWFIWEKKVYFLYFVKVKDEDYLTKTEKFCVPTLEHTVALLNKYIGQSLMSVFYLTDSTWY